MEPTELISLGGVIEKTIRRAEGFHDLHESLQKNLWTSLPLTLDALAGAHYIAKNLHMTEVTKQIVSSSICFRTSIEHFQ
jgi:nuclear pore complex protein Nup93